MAKKNEQKAYVKIQSSMTLNVTPGLQNEDVTNPDAHVADRLKINATWPKAIVLIQAGVHWYPSEIAEWATVKSLAKDKILSIVEFNDIPEDKPVIEKEKFVADLKEAKILKEETLDDLA